MKVLVAIGSDRERHRILDVLAAARYDACQASTTAAAHQLLATNPDIAIVDLSLVQRARSIASRIFVIAVLDAAAPPSDYSTAYQAGADDVMCIAAGRDEIVGRTGALRRIREWAHPPSAADKLAAIATWQQLDEIIGAELGELVGERLARRPFAPQCVVFASDIALSLAAEHLQIRLGLAIDATTTSALQHSLLGGDTSPAAVADAMRELANTAGGALKRAALGNGIEFTVGLPTNNNILTLDQPNRRAWCLQGGHGISFSCIAVPCSTAPKRVLASDLREGMVLARDVRTTHGSLIASAGTNLTSTTVLRLVRVLGSAATLEISDLAA